MIKDTKDEKFKEKLEYIGLNLEEIPEFLMKYEPIDYRVNAVLEDREHVVYQYVPIDKIQILITPTSFKKEIYRGSSFISIFKA